MQNKITHLFPAFVLKYTGKELNIIEKYGYDFHKRVRLSNELLDLNLEEFDIIKNNFTNEELKNQVFSYIFSCIFSDILYENKKTPKLISGFSMGLYAALYHAKSINFNTGLLLINDIFNEIKQILSNKKYVMASVIGFSQSDLELFTFKLKNVEIVIQNGIYSFVISGKEAVVKPLLEKLQLEGAIHVSLFNVSFPYHSKILRNHTHTFELIANKYQISNPKIPLISMTDQTELTTIKQVKSEMVKNIIKPLNFFKTIQTLNDLGIKQFIEVGAGTSLLKSSKFIEGDFDFQAISNGKIL